MSDASQADSAVSDDAAPHDDVDPARRTRALLVLGGVAALVIAIDQLSKWWVVATIRPRIESGEGPIELLGGLVRITYLENTGAAFSMLTGYTWIFTAIALVVIIVIARSARRLGSLWWAVALGGLLGGSIGNLIDRFVREPSPGLGHVVDFIAVPHFAVFNGADSAITCSAILMVVLALRGVSFGGAPRTSA